MLDVILLVILRYILEKYGKKRGIEELKGYTPENPSTTSMVEALAVAWREMGNKSWVPTPYSIGFSRFEEF